MAESTDNDREQRAKARERRMQAEEDRNRKRRSDEARENRGQGGRQRKKLGETTAADDRKARVAKASWILAGIGLVLSFGLLFFDADSIADFTLMASVAQLSWVLIGVAAVGWIIHEALPNE